MNPHYATTVFQAKPPPDGWPDVFAIITACNPNGKTDSATRNAMRDAQLAAKFNQVKPRCWHWRVVGGSPDLRHAEPGFAVELPLQDAIAIGNDFEQEAIFWIENDRLSVIACQGNEQDDLGSWRHRLAQGNALPMVALFSNAILH